MDGEACIKLTTVERKDNEKKKKSSMQKVLSYGDSCLRQADVDLLRGPQWLNDQIISFYFEYLARDKFKDLVDSHCVLLVQPSFAFMLASLSSPEEGKMLMESMKADQAELVVFAINDSTDVERANAGCHWTVLAFERSTQTFRHYDSASGSNYASAQAAHRVINATRSALGMPDYSSHRMVDVDKMPRQQNGYDCGVYACATAATLCAWKAEGKSCQEQEPRLTNALSGVVPGWRTFTLELIDRLKAQ